jgi:hypothetical protein
MSLVEQIMFLRGMAASSSVDMAAGGNFRLLSLTSKGTHRYLKTPDSLPGS